MDIRHDHKIDQAERGNVENDNPMRVFNNEKVEAYDQTDFSIEDIPDGTIQHTTGAQPRRGLNARHIQMISLGGCIGYNKLALSLYTMSHLFIQYGFIP